MVPKQCPFRRPTIWYLVYCATCLGSRDNSKYHTYTHTYEYIHDPSRISIDCLTPASRLRRLSLRLELNSTKKDIGFVMSPSCKIGKYFPHVFLKTSLLRRSVFQSTLGKDFPILHLEPWRILYIFLYFFLLFKWWMEWDMDSRVSQNVFCNDVYLVNNPAAPRSTYRTYTGRQTWPDCPSCKPSL